MSSAETSEAVFESLKSILKPFEPALILKADDPDNYYLNTPFVQEWKKEMFFGAVQIKKKYVSFHLMPVYVQPNLLDEVSPELRKRMQGKSCFNFRQADGPLLEELALLTERGFELYREKGYVSL